MNRAAVFDELLAMALTCLSHVPLLSGYDELETLSYQIILFGPISAYVRHLPSLSSDLRPKFPPALAESSV